MFVTISWQSQFARKFQIAIGWASLVILLCAFDAYSGEIGGVAEGALGFGHYDNLTKAKSWSGPKLKSGITRFMFYAELGASYKRASGSYYITYISTGHRTASSFMHEGGVFDGGILLRMRSLSMKSMVNFTPVIGHKIYREEGRIYDPELEAPDSLNFGYSDNGMFYGLDFQIRLKKLDPASDLRLTLGYIYEELNKKADRFRIELGLFGFFGEGNPNAKSFFNEFGAFFIRFESVKWNDGRNSRFVTVGLGANAK